MMRSRFGFSSLRAAGFMLIVACLFADGASASAQGFGGSVSGRGGGIRAGVGFRSGGNTTVSHASHVNHPRHISRFGHFNHSLRYGYGRFRYGGRTVYLGYGYYPGYCTGYYSPAAWYLYPSWSYTAYPVYVPQPYPVYVDRPAVPETLPAASTASGDDGDEYYLFRRPTALPTDPGLTEAISDIEHAFRASDLGWLKRHVERADSITFLTRARGRQSFTGAEYLDRTQDAFSTLKTSSFDLRHAEPVEGGDWTISGIHSVKPEDGKEARYEVSFRLHKSGDVWMIREVTADPAR